MKKNLRYFNPCHAKSILYIKNGISNSIISQHWDGAGSWNPSWWKTGTSLSYMVNAMATDVLASPGTGISVVMMHDNSYSGHEFEEWSGAKRTPQSVAGELTNDYVMSYSCMMTSPNGNIFRVTGHLCGEFTGPRWIPHTKASGAELWCFLWSAPN